MIAFQQAFHFYHTSVPGSQALSAMGHDADEGGHQDAGDGGQHDSAARDRCSLHPQGVSLGWDGCAVVHRVHAQGGARGDG